MFLSIALFCLFFQTSIFPVSGINRDKVTQLPVNVTEPVGANVSFQCWLHSFQNDQAVKVIWWKQGDPHYLNVEQDDRKVTGRKNKYSGFLQIFNVNVQDRGMYYCTIVRQGKLIGNGTGSNLTVLVPPTPLNILSQQPGKDPSVTLAVLCSTSPFYPSDISFTWYKDGSKTTTGISTVIRAIDDRLYEAYSRLEETQAIRARTVYTCMVSHSTLQISAVVSHIVTNGNPDRAITKYLMISANVSGGMILLVLSLIIVKRYAAKKSIVKSNDEKSSNDEHKGITDTMTPYAALTMNNLQKAPRPRHHEMVVYAQIGEKLRKQ
ncbi:signal-regulatory protein beta-1-like isoform X2 [Hemiscyllium ocellatum]|uniref:signal-regulatory protein beta-1-like isoform X2 n=1 Tax=Hemiscyllium ocellatum TaxID=170820 RepID=UPI002966AE0D|nr:signal-regulatory protein beta-1-like isoform X2 [Hemiscyllium ocellatum]